MNFPKFSPDDPRLTAYALGELEGGERAAVEAALRDDPAAQAAVEEIRATAALLSAALAEEAAADLPAGAAPALTKAAIVQGNDYRKLDGGPLGRLIKFPQLYYVVGGLAAACFAVLVVLRSPEPQPAAAKIYREVALAPAPVAAVESGPMPVPLAIEEKKDAAQLVLALPAPPMVADQSRDNHALLKAAASRVGSQRSERLRSPRTTSGSTAVNYTFGADSGGTALAQLPAAVPSQGSFAMLQSPSSQSLQTNSANKSTDRWVETGGGWNHPALPLDPAIDADRAFALKTVDLLSQTKLLGPVLTERPGLFQPGSLAPATGTVGKFPLGFTVAEEHSLKVNSATATRTGMEIQSGPRDIGAISIQRRPKDSAALNTEAYAYVRENDFLGAAENPRSTFSVNVDTASYANVRRFIQAGRLPPADAVRVEELVNYLPYHYAPPTGDAPFAVAMEVADAPWAAGHRLVRIGLKGREVATAARPAANLVFLIDVSGSMNEPNKLPLVKEAMRLLLGRLRPDDRVAIVVYAGASGLALPSTPAAKSREILAALDALNASGPTNGALGLQLAYDIAKANFIPGGVNRVILCTDGDFNVGITSEGELTRLIQEKAKSGVSLTALGFGMGNYKDATLKQLADQGNGSYGYIDTRREAEKLLVEQVNGMLMPVAKDVKLQVEFNPAQVASYRLIGYEDRLLKQEDFNHDAMEGGEIGAGHTVTALYEIVPVENPKSEIRNPKLAALLTLKVRYREPAGTVSLKREFPLTDGGARFAAASADFKFAAAVAEFGMILRDSPYKGTGTLDQAAAWAEAGTDSDAGGYRGEFVELVRQAEALMR